MICKTCLKELPIASFYPRHKNCKECCIARTIRLRRERNLVEQKRKQEFHDDLLSKGLKFCSRCKQSHPISDFEKRTGGSYPSCVRCRNATAKRYYWKGKENARKLHLLMSEESERLQRMGLKRCRECDTVKSVDTFYQTHAKCKACYSARKQRQQYGMDTVDKSCEICGVDENLRVDHDHRSGKTRGVLCQTCNFGLGHFKDNPTLLFRAIEYLQIP